jgi:hypothetical protein
MVLDISVFLSKNEAVLIEIGQSWPANFWGYGFTYAVVFLGKKACGLFVSHSRFPQNMQIEPPTC